MREPRPAANESLRWVGPPVPVSPGAMSVAFVPERLRGKAEVNQETLQRVSAGVRDRGGGGVGGAGAPGSAEAEPAPAASAGGGGGGPRRAVTRRSCALAAGGERPADPVHRGVPEQGPGHRLRAVSDPGSGARRWAPGRPLPAPPGSETRLLLSGAVLT